MKELKFKNAKYGVLYVAIFVSICILFMCAMGSIVTCIWEDGKDLVLGLKISTGALLFTWLIAVLAILFNKTVVVNMNEIKMYRGKKLKWCIKKEDIVECIYNKMEWYGFLTPIECINCFALQFKLKGEKGISRKSCSLSMKQVKKIQAHFDYPIKLIDSIYEQ